MHSFASISSSSSLPEVRRSVRLMFDEARRLREFGIMKSCLSRLIDLSEQLEDETSLQQYRTLFRVLQPILQEKDRQSALPSPSGLPSTGGKPMGGDVFSPAARLLPTGGNFNDTLALALKSGWLPSFPFAFEQCLLTARIPFVTPAEIAQFAEYRSGILVFLSDEFATLCPPPAPLPAITLVFQDGYRGPLPPAPPGWEADYGEHVLRTMAIWQMDQQSGWGGFFETTPSQLESWYARHGHPLPESSAQFSQTFFYCLTDLENERAHSS